MWVWHHLKWLISWKITKVKLLLRKGAVQCNEIHTRENKQTKVSNSPTIFPSMWRVFPIRCSLFSPLHGGMRASSSLQRRLAAFESPYMGTVRLILGRRLGRRGQICRDMTTALARRRTRQHSRWLTNFILREVCSITHRLAVYLSGIDRS